MRTFESGTASSYRTRDIEVARWEQYCLGELVPFQGMWYTVPPGASTPPDRHPERELSVVVSGAAAIEAAGRTAEVQQGDGFLFDSLETHVIRNTSDIPLLVFSTYWMPAGAMTSPLTGGDGARPVAAGMDEG